MSLSETGRGEGSSSVVILLSINLPKYYRECFECFSHCSAATSNNVLGLSHQEASITEASFKKVYRETGIATPPTAHSKFNESFSGVCLDWKKIHSLPFLVALDTKSQEFQNKIINRYLVRNTFLQKVGKIDSSLCTFCGMLDESVEHFFET